MKKVKLLIFIGLGVLGQVIMILSVINLYNESKIIAVWSLITMLIYIIYIGIVAKFLLKEDNNE